MHIFVNVFELHVHVTRARARSRRAVVMTRDGARGATPSSSTRGDRSRVVGPTAAGAPTGAVAATAAGKTTTGSGSASAGGKRGGGLITIRPFARAPKVPKDVLRDARGMIRDAIEAVRSRTPTKQSHETLYRAVENLCVHKRADEAYGDFRNGADVRAREVLQGLDKGKIPDASVFLSSFDAAWGEYCSQALTLRSIFLYLDRTARRAGATATATTTATNGAMPQMPLWELCLKLFYEHLQSFGGVSNRILKGLLELIERERMGEQIDRALAKRVLRALSSLGVYASFETMFMGTSQEFYRKEGNEYSAQTDVSDYLKHCERRLAEEAERCANYLDSSTSRGLMRVCEQELIEAHIGDILEKGFVDLMRQHRLEDLKRLHTLLGRMDGGSDRLCAAFVSYLKQQGTAIVKDEANDKDMVERLLAMKTAVDEVVTQAFGRTASDGTNDIFINGVKESFESFINCRQNVPAELIAKYIDSKLKSGNKGTSDEEIEITLDKALVLFRYIVGKDVFEGFYKKELAKRLLHGKSASIDAEKSMISKLKAECGSQFTQHLEGMFKDIELSREIMTNFRQATEGDQKLSNGIEMGVNVITAGCWPTYPSVDVKLPSHLSVLQERFESFYLGKYSGRKLTWQNSQSHCVLKTRFANGQKELSVSLFQCIVLMLFNDAEKLSYQAIAEGSGLEEKELKRALQSLACGKVRILNKEPKSRDVNDDDVFEFNAGLNERLFRIKVNSIQLKETVDENKQTMERVFQDRQHQIDACIVRIMKTRKTLTHSLLISELMSQLKFPTKASDLKKRIESLIDREFIERDGEDAQKYNYLA